MPGRADDWLRQAQRDLKHSPNALKDCDFEWSCFAAQQTAEKGRKAVYQAINMDAQRAFYFGFTKRVGIVSPIQEVFYSYSKILSRYYIETRYANGFPEGAPFEYFDENMAREAIRAAEAILEWCRNIISKSK